MNNPREFKMAVGAILAVFVGCAFPLDPTPTPPPVPRLPPEAPALVVLWTKEYQARAYRRGIGSAGDTIYDTWIPAYVTNTAYTIGFYDSNGTPVVLHTFTP